MYTREGFVTVALSWIVMENWEDQRTWDEFYRTYWRLIYSVALKAGMREDEAWDVVQETILSIAQQSKKNIYKPEQGSFCLLYTSS